MTIYWTSPNRALGIESMKPTPWANSAVANKIGIAKDPGDSDISQENEHTD